MPGWCVTIGTSVILRIAMLFQLTPVGVRKIRSMKPIAVCLATWALLPLGGCAPAPPAKPEQMDPSQERLLLVGQVYRQFNGEQRRPPQSAADLLPLLQKRGAGEEALRSERDGRPFEVLWGLDVRNPPTGPGRPVLAYEKLGVAGTRLVLSTMGNVELVGDEALKASHFASGFQPPN